MFSEVLVRKVGWCMVSGELSKHQIEFLVGQITGFHKRASAQIKEQLCQTCSVRLENVVIYVSYDMN